MKIKFIALLSISLVLSGCYTNQYNSLSQDAIDAKNRDIEAWKKTLPAADADYGPYPGDYEKVIKNYFYKKLKDPESARYGEFSKPRRKHFIRDQSLKDVVYGYAVCVSINAKNSYGGYTGVHDYWFFIRNGIVVNSYDTEEVMFGVKIYKRLLADCEEKK